MSIQSHRNTVKHVCLACSASATDKTIEALFTKRECLGIIIQKLLHLVLGNTFLLLSLASTMHIDVLSLELS